MQLRLLFLDGIYFQTTNIFQAHEEEYLYSCEWVLLLWSRILAGLLLVMKAQRQALDPLQISVLRVRDICGR